MALRLRLAPLACIMVMGAACGSEPPRDLVLVGMNLQAPQGLIDNVESMKLYVASQDGATQCTPETGIVSTNLTGSGAQSFDLRRGTVDAPCPNDAAFCSEEITLPQDKKPLVFQAIGLRGGDWYAVGCANAAVNSNPFYVHLVVHRYVPPAACGNGTIEPGEQCEPPSGNDNCDDQCRTKEILLSSDSVGSPPGQEVTNNPPKSKSKVALTWNPGGPLHAVYQDDHFYQTGPEVNYRQMTADFLQVMSPALLGGQIRLPIQCTGCSQGFVERASTQAAPAIALLSDSTLQVVYADSRTSTAGKSNISMTPLSEKAVPEADVVYFDTTTAAELEVTPSVAAGPTGLSMFVWADSGAKEIRGRVWSQTKKAWFNPNILPLVIASGGASNPRVAGSNTGWKVVWDGASADAHDILMADVTVTNVAKVSAPKLVNESTSGVQQQPWISMLPTGEAAVVWNDGGAIMMQRFDTSGASIAGDQGAPVNTDGTGETPSVSASSLAGGFFSITWASGGTIQARYADLASGYLFNSIDGQDGPFQVNDASSEGPRLLPAVAAGGNGFVVFAWQDESASHYGIYGRRFPLPLR